MIDLYTIRDVGQAVALVIARPTEPDGGPLTRVTVNRLIDLGVPEDDILNGLVTLGTMLLDRVEDVTGNPAFDDLGRDRRAPALTEGQLKRAVVAPTNPH